MRRALFDTSVYVDWLNAGRHADLLFSPETLQYLSAVVLLELHAGASTRSELRLLGTLAATFKKVGRVVVPAAMVWEDAGMVLRSLSARGFQLAGAHGLVNDVLIALSARAIGATVFTKNVRHFEAIRTVRRFDLIPVTA